MNPSAEAGPEGPADPKPPSPVSLRALFTDSALFGVGRLVDRVLGFLLLPITTALLTPADYGTLSLFGTSAYVLSLLIALGLPNAFLRWCTEAADPGERRRLEADARRWIHLLGRFATAAGLLLGVLLDPGGLGFVVLTLATAYGSALEHLGSARQQADGAARRYIVVQGSSSLLHRGLGLALLLWGWKVDGLMTARVAALALAVWMLRPRPPAEPTDNDRSARPWNVDMARYGASLTPALLSHWLMTGADKWLLRLLLPDPLRQIGLYTVGERIGDVMQFVGLAFLLGWRRYAFHNMHLAEGPALIARAVAAYVVIGAYAALALALLGDDLTHWLIPSAYEEGMAVIPPLTLACLLGTLAELGEIGLHKARRAGWISFLHLSAAALNVVLNLIFIPRFGILGAAWSTLFCQFLKAGLIWFMTLRVFPIPIPWRDLGPAVGGLLLAYFIGASFQNWGWVASGSLQSLTVFLAGLPIAYKLDLKGRVLDRLWSRQAASSQD